MIGFTTRKKLGAFAIPTAVFLALSLNNYVAKDSQSATAAGKTTLKLQFALGVGNSPCREWIASGNSVDKKSPISQWLLGIVSGNNFFFVGRESVFLDYDADGLLRNFHEYCSAHPNDLVYLAVVDFFEEDLQVVSTKRLQKTK